MMDRWFNPHSVHSLQAMIGDCQPANVCAFHIDQAEKRKSEIGSRIGRFASVDRKIE